MILQKLFYNLIFYISCGLSVMPIHAGVSEKSGPHFPVVTFRYDWRGKSLDVIGRWMLQNVTLPQLKSGLYKQLPGLKVAWKKEVPLLFMELFSVFNRGIKAKERTAILYLSNAWSYGSDRFLVLGLRWILDPEPWVFKVNREDSFTATIFHELLHIWVDENISQESPLLKKYNIEESEVRNHIHLMALQKMVYQKLGREDILEMLDEQYRKRSLASYRRAWEIVNDIEGYEVVLQDIRKSLKIGD